MSNFMAAGWVASAAPKTKTQKLKKTIGELSFALSVKDQTTSNIISLTGGLSTFEGFTLRASCLTCSIKGYPYFLLAYISISDLQNWT